MTAAANRPQAWEALSGLFVDNDIDYDDIAAALDGLPEALIEEILFQEVAPYCGSNLLTPVPPVWSGFDAESLSTGITAMQTRSRRSHLARLRQQVLTLCCRCYFREEWQCLCAALLKRRGG
ncbi:hypothetical protein [uncultured Aquitalea sp.]|uniref:DUF7079 family protein n=1 Tax=uncultured Aquitalea sp. TaxID=540272 RepID=UPI0025E857A8|nr:hypothetical protein [uncultured Aquitalea sp.]